MKYIKEFAKYYNTNLGYYKEVLLSVYNVIQPLSKKNHQLTFHINDANSDLFENYYGVTFDLTFPFSIKEFEDYDLEKENYYLNCSIHFGDYRLPVLECCKYGRQPSSLKVTMGAYEGKLPYRTEIEINQRFKYDIEEFIMNRIEETEKNIPNFKINK